VSARADRLLGERQSITDSKKFRAAKKKLGIIFRRDGFGCGGEWFWELPTTSKTKAIETALDPAAKKAAMVVYAETHSRPDDHDQLPDHGRDDGLQGDPALREWDGPAVLPPLQQAKLARGIEDKGARHV
jgi:hypothetical protein